MSFPELESLREIILDNLGAGSFICDAAKRGFPIVRISPSFTALTGYSAEEAVGQRLTFLYGTRTDPAVTKAVQRALSRGQPFRGELLCYRADGKTVWCELITVPRPPAGGSSSCFVMTLIDISERKRREEQLLEREANCRRIFDNAVEGIYQSTPEGRYLQVNAALARMYGYRNTDALLNSVSDIQNQIYVDPTMREVFKKLIHGADYVRGLEYQVRRRDGRIIWISENARVVRDANGRARYYEGFIEEITQRKEAEAALQVSQQRLLETSRQIGLAEMANGILHNVGNALNSVGISASVVTTKVNDAKLGNVSKIVALLRQHEADLPRFLTTDPKGRELVAYLDKLARHLAGMQSDLLDELKTLKKTVEHASEIIASQQSAARAGGHTETLPAAELVEDALRMNANSLTRHGIEIVRDYAPDLPDVTVQKHQVLQILVNLIRNAQKACDASDREKRLTLRVNSDAGKARVRFEVCDSGVGMSRETLGRLFTHGFTTRKDGHGFGLHSGARIARELGGSLTAHSDGAGKGATFILEFPCRPSAPNKPAEKTARQALPA